MKVPEPRKLKSGNWFVQLRLGGVSVPVTAPTEKECRRQAALIKAEHLAGRRQAQRAELTLGGLLDDYITRYKDVLSPSTLRGYKQIRRNRFPGWIDRPVARIRDWQAMISTELRGSSPKTVANGWGLVTAALRDRGLPVPEVKLPPVPEQDLPFLEPEEILRFVAAAEGDSCEAAMLLELHSLRESEALQVLRHADELIDLDHGVIRVRGAYVRSEEASFAEKQTNKSRAGTRTVPIVIPRLSSLVRAARDAGEPLPVPGTTQLLRHVHAVCARAGVTDVGNHGLRRSFATLAYSLGWSERMTMEVGGWDDAATMHKCYVKLAQRDRGKAAGTMAEFFAPQTPQTPETRLRAALYAIDALRADYGDLPQLREIFEAADRLRAASAEANATQKR